MSSSWGKILCDGDFCAEGLSGGAGQVQCL